MKSKEVHNKMSKSCLLRSLISPQPSAAPAKMRTFNRPRDAPSEPPVPEPHFSQVRAGHPVEAVAGRPAVEARRRAQSCSDDQAAALEELRHARSTQHRRSFAALPGQIKVLQKSIRGSREEQAAVSLPQTELAQSCRLASEGRHLSPGRLCSSRKLASLST